MLARIPTSAVPELELKFQLGQGAYEALVEFFSAYPSSVSELHAIYFDTRDHALRDEGFSLRVRRHGERYVQTLKHRAAGGLFERDEWEIEVPGAALDHEALGFTPVSRVVGADVLDAAFSVEVERRQLLWTHGDDEIEISIDLGWIVADDRKEPIAEIELELLSGSPASLFALAEKLQPAADLTLSFESKAQRGYRLAGHDEVAALAARQLAVGSGTTTAEAFKVIAREGLVQIAGNARLLQRSHNPEVLHQTRVGLRRLRAAMTVFKLLLDPAGLAQARRETRWLGRELSPARDLDALLARIANTDGIGDIPGRAAFLSALRLAQTEAYERALTALGSPRYKAMLLMLGQWIEIGAWTLDASSDVADRPVEAVAAPILHRLHRRLGRGLRKFRSLTPEARHELRKKAKTLRYASAFLSGVFDSHPGRRKRYVAALRELQDQLGALNDISVARTLVKRVVGRIGGEMAFAAGLEIGRMSAEEARVLQVATKSVRNYRKVRAFWVD
ncbi:MAG: CHAD domain-containing protein [Alphaproteobacteria bacterium]